MEFCVSLLPLSLSSLALAWRTGVALGLFCFFFTTSTPVTALHHSNGMECGWMDRWERRNEEGLMHSIAGVGGGNKPIVVIERDIGSERLIDLF